MSILYLLEAITVFLVVIGTYRLLLFFSGRASSKAYKIAVKITKISKSENAIIRLTDDLSILLSKFIKLDEYRYQRLKNMLKYKDNITKEPKIFIAQNIIKSSIILLFGIVFIPFMPVITFGVVIIALFSYYMAENSLLKNYIKKKREIENELPHFCAVITQEVKATKDVLGILSRYMPSANKALKEELKVLIADMNSSNYESALKRFEVRLGMEKVAEIVRGLIGTVRGDDTVVYFQMLSRDLDQLELQRLNDIASMQPRKVGKYQLIVLAVMISNYIIVMILYVMGLGKPF